MEPMPDPPDPSAAASLQPIPRPLSDILVETAVVLLVCVVPEVFTSIALPLLPKGGTDSFIYQYLSRTLHSISIIGLVLYIIYRSGEPYSQFGLKPLKPRVDLAGGIGVFFLGMLGYYAVWIILAGILGQKATAALANQDLSSFASPTGRGSYLLLAVASIANGFAEELVVRSYLIPRFERIFSSTPLALLLSTGVFASYHTYQGTGGVISVAAIGLVYGWIFCRFRRLWPLAIGHGTQDLISLLFWLK